MRTKAAIAAMAVLTGLMVSLQSGAVAAAPTPTENGQIQFFNMSARLVNLSNYPSDKLDWRLGFRRIAEYAHLADVITVLEVPLPMRATVLRQIEAALGADFGWVHSDTAISQCRDSSLSENRRKDECGNSMIAFRIAKLAKNCEGCGVKTWAPFNQQNKQPCAQRGNATHVMARLLDRAQEKIVTVVPVHFDPGLNRECLALNMKKLNDILEADEVWRNRPMTVVLGDFNEHADARHEMGKEDPEVEASWRREEQKACWYARFSLQTDDGSCDPGAAGTSWSFPYTDAIGVKNGTGTDDICSEWTFSNMFGLTTKVRDDADLCNPEGRVRKRIDHVWVRYETSDGAAITDSSSTWTDAQVVEAGVDQGYYDSSSAAPKKYSDHRMMHTRLSWCGAQSGGFATPCD